MNETEAKIENLQRQMRIASHRIGKLENEAHADANQPVNETENPMSINLENMIHIHSNQIGTLQARVAKLEQDTRTKDTPASPPEKSESGGIHAEIKAKEQIAEVLKQLGQERSFVARDKCSAETSPWEQGLHREILRLTNIIADLREDEKDAKEKAQLIITEYREKVEAVSRENEILHKNAVGANEQINELAKKVSEARENFHKANNELNWLKENGPYQSGYSNGHTAAIAQLQDAVLKLRA